jgi:lathosterol oxidase
MLERLWDSLVVATMVTASHAAIFVIAERIWPVKPEQKHLRAGVGLDLFYSYFGVFLMTLVNLSWIGVSVDAMKKTASIGPALSALQGFVGARSYAVALVLAVVIADFAGYWKHRMMHTRLLWPFHAVHHSSEEVDFLSNERQHPLETVLTNFLLFGPLVLFGFPPAIIGVAAAIRRTHSVYEHTNLRFSYGPLSYLFVSPTFHRWHHSSDADVVDKNYANVFSLFDWMFGTYHVPTDRSSPNTYGIAGFPRTFWGQLVQPFRELANVFTSAKR